MSRFINFLNENKLQPDDGQMIKSECSLFINDLVNSGTFPNFMYSGRQRSGPGFKGIVRKDRKPKDIPPNVHRGLDEGFYKEFGIRARSQTLFCTPIFSTAETYGRPFIILPIGNYKIIGSKQILDLFSFYEDNIQHLELATDIDIGQDVHEGLEDLYYDEYGEGTDGGSWHYKGTGLNTQDLTAAVDEVFQEKYSDGYLDQLEDQEIDDISNQIENIKLDIEDNITWEPKITYEQFLDQYIEQSTKKLNQKLNSYQIGDLHGALNSKFESEIMLYCDHYIGVSYMLETELIRLIREDFT